MDEPEIPTHDESDMAEDAVPPEETPLLTPKKKGRLMTPDLLAKLAEARAKANMVRAEMKGKSKEEKDARKLAEAKTKEEARLVALAQRNENKLNEKTELKEKLKSVKEEVKQSIPKTPRPPKEEPKKKKKKKIIVVNESSSDSEDEIIYARNRRKPRESRVLPPMPDPRVNALQEQLQRAMLLNNQFLEKQKKQKEQEERDRFNMRPRRPFTNVMF